MKLTRSWRYSARGAVALLLFASVALSAWSQSVTGLNIVILLRLTGESRALPQLGSCLNSKLLKMPDIKIATAPTNGVRFVVDIIAEKGTNDGIFASLVIAETFPMEQFRPRLKQGEDADALLGAIRYYTLLRLHEVVLGQTAQGVCTKIAAELSDKLLSKEYTERDD